MMMMGTKARSCRNHLPPRLLSILVQMEQDLALGQAPNQALGQTQDHVISPGLGHHPVQVQAQAQPQGQALGHHVRSRRHLDRVQVRSRLSQPSPMVMDLHRRQVQAREQHLD